ncbi:carboxypeptidase-like regulatory domain-containing protein, partial [Methanobrevibacter sp.]|uniref:carboxypeptidase-like regulatory domain-containing protein n=1 Tax=Methanobrevibacter sp. TaxID=66852 RepID=UPI00388E5BA1
LTVAGKTYTRKTNSDGVASLPINLGVGNYTVSASFDGSSNFGAVEISRTIVVNPPVYELVAEDVDMVYQDGTSYNVQITDTQGNPVAQAGVVIKVTINGKSYDRKTNEDGIASLPINLRAGTYEITAEYNGKQITNTIVVNNA